MSAVEGTFFYKALANHFRVRRDEARGENDALWEIFLDLLRDLPGEGMPDAAAEAVTRAGERARALLMPVGGA